MTNLKAEDDNGIINAFHTIMHINLHCGIYPKETIKKKKLSWRIK